MKKVYCEVCNGTEIIKDDGFFLCQSCGCKYSLEEMKKMIESNNFIDSNNTDLNNASTQINKTNEPNPKKTLTPKMIKIAILVLALILLIYIIVACIQSNNSKNDYSDTSYSYATNNGIESEDEYGDAEDDDSNTSYSNSELEKKLFAHYLANLNLHLLSMITI